MARILHVQLVLFSAIDPYCQFVESNQWTCQQPGLFGASYGAPLTNNLIDITCSQHQKLHLGMRIVQLELCLPHYLAISFGSNSHFRKHLRYQVFIQPLKHSLILDIHSYSHLCAHLHSLFPYTLALPAHLTLICLSILLLLLWGINSSPHPRTLYLTSWIYELQLLIEDLQVHIYLLQHAYHILSASGLLHIQ